MKSIETGLFAILLCLFYTTVSFLLLGSPENQFVDADSLQITFLVRDIFSDKAIAGWRLPPAPYYFPDLLLHCLFWPWDFHPNILFPFYSFFLLSGYGLAFYFLLLASHRSPLSPSKAERRNFRIWSLGALFVWLLFLVFYPKHSMPFLPALLPGFHGGVLFVAFVLLVLIAISTRQFSLQKAGLLVLLLALAWPSDKGILPVFCLPALATLLLLASRLDRPWLWILAIVLGIFLGHYLESALRRTLPFSFSSLGWKFRQTELLENIFSAQKEEAFFLYFLKFPKAFWGILAFWAVSFLWSVATIFSGQGRSRGRAIKSKAGGAFRRHVPPAFVAASENIVLFLNVFVFFAICSNVLALWILLFPQEAPGVMRYWEAAAVFPLFAGIFNLKNLLQRHFSLSTGTVLLVLVLAFGSLFVLGRLPKPLSPRALRNFAPKEAVCLQKLARKRNLHTGLADYWIAKPLEVYSGLALLQITPELIPFYWNNNPNRFLKNPYYDFVIRNRLKKDPRIFFGVPKEIQQCGKLKIYIYSGASGTLLRSLYHFPLDMQLWKQRQFLSKSTLQNGKNKKQSK